MIRPLILALLAPTVALADAPAGLADRAWSISEAVLSRSIDPPTRQAMLLYGLKAARAAAKEETPPTFAREVSAATTADQFAAILDRAWPGSSTAATAGQVESALIEGMLAAVPGEAELISAKDLRVAEQVEGNLYVGVQIALGPENEISAVLPGGPADKAGALKGDRIEAVDGVDVSRMPLKEVVDRLRGPIDTEVAVGLRRAGVAGRIERKMVRGILPRVTVEGFRKRPDGGWDVRLDGPAAIGHLKISEIVGSTPVELARFAEQVESEGIKALILDLRQVSHGGLHAATLLADSLLDGGTIGRVRSADSVETIRAEADELFPGRPIAVLVAGGMPAEARWLCAALEDNARASIVGTTGGHGREVRSAVPLPGGDWSVRMATGRLERADGRPIPEYEPVARRGSGIATRELDRDYAVGVSGNAPAIGPPGAKPIKVDALRQAQAILEAKLKGSGS